MIPESVKKAAQEEIAKLLAEALNLIFKAEQIADRCDVEFKWDGPSYDMGGTYRPVGTDFWDSSTRQCEMGYGDSGWTANKDD